MIILAAVLLMALVWVAMGNNAHEVQQKVAVRVRKAEKRARRTDVIED